MTNIRNKVYPSWASVKELSRIYRERKNMTDIRIIDVHSHMLFTSYLEGLKEMGIDPVREDGFPTPEWSA